MKVDVYQIVQCIACGRTDHAPVKDAAPCATCGAARKPVATFVEDPHPYPGSPESPFAARVDNSFGARVEFDY